MAYLEVPRMEISGRSHPAPVFPGIRSASTWPRQPGTPGQDLLEPWGDQIYQWLTGNRLQMTRIHELLALRGCPMSYPPQRRFILKRN